MSITRTTIPPGDAVPSPTTPQLGGLEVVGPVCLLAAATVAVVLAVVLLWAPPKPPLAHLTIAGMVNVIPEHDVTVYLASGAAFLALVGALASRSGAPGRLGRSGRGARSAILSLIGAAGASLAAVSIFAHARNRLPGAPRIRLSELSLFALLAAACAVAAWTVSPGRPRSPTLRVVDETPAPLRRHLADILVPLAVIAIVYMPQWRSLAGNAFTGEEFLHIDFFAMGPALAFKKGVALGTTLHPYYGFGWALVLAKLPLVGTGSYGRFIRLEVVYGCIYFIAVYALLRLLVGRWQWAAAGTVLAFLLQMFGSFSAAFDLWRFPSATVLRWAFDVWFFVACLLYLRTRRAGWILLGGVIVGLALLFETDTGIYLGLSAGFFWICLWRLAPAEGRRLIRMGAAAAASGFGVLAVGLGIASRWTLFSGAFWNGWTENLRITQAGATLEPLTGLVGHRVLAFFALMMLTYLIVAGCTVARFVRRQLTPTLVVLGSISVYGFLTLLYFVGRSNPHNLFRPAVPFAIVVAGCGGALQARLRGWFGAGHHNRALSVAARALPSAALLMALTMLALHPGFRAYPSMAKTVFTGMPPDRLCVLRNPDDICDVDPRLSDYVGQLHAVADHLRTIDAPTRQVAILDTEGPLLYRMAGARPWGRYLPLFPGLFFKDMVRAVVSDLHTSPPDIVVMRSHENNNPFFDDVWRAMRPSVERNYTIDSRYGPFEIWKRRTTIRRAGVKP